MSKAIIDFEKGDISALKEISDKLQAIIDKEGAVGEAWKQTSTDMNAQSKTNVDTTNKLAQSIDQMAVASKSMDKVVIGGAYKNYLTQIQQTLGLTSKELVAYIQNARQAAQESIISSKDDQQVKDTTLSIEVMNDQLKQLGVSADSTGVKSQNFTTQIRAVRNELLAMTEAGQRGSAEFVALESKYAEMQRISKQFMIESQGLVKNSEVLNGIASILTGVAGSYQVATGAAILFGDGNQDLQIAMQKLFAVMSLVQGLEQVLAVLQKSSAASILVESLARKTQTAAVISESTAEVANNAVKETGTAILAESAIASTADATAKTVEAGATEAATVAQKGLNVAFLASPIGILILSVGTLVGLYEIFTINSEKALKAQQQLNKELELAIATNNSFVDAIGKAGDVLLAQAKQRGSQAEEIRLIETNNLKEQLTQTLAVEDSKRAAYERTMDVLRLVASGKLDLNKDEIKAEEDTRDKFEAIQKKRIDLENKLELKTIDNVTAANKEKQKSFEDYQNARVAATIAGTDKERQAEIESMTAIAKERENDADFQSKSDAEKALIRANDEKKIQGLQLQNYQHYLKDRTAAIDAEIAKEKAHSAINNADQIATINKITDLQIEAIKRQKAESLSNPTLDPGEQQKIINEANKAITDAENKRDQDILNVRKKNIELLLAASEKGTYDEYVYKLALIENSRQAEISAADKNKDLIKAIDAKYRKQKQDADIAFTVTQLNNEISRDNAALDHFGVTENEKLDLTIKRLNDQRAIEIEQANGNASKIAEINARYNKEALQLRLDSIDIIKNKELQSLQIQNDAFIKLQQKIAGSDLSPLGDKINALKALQDEKDAELLIQQKALEKQRELELNSVGDDVQAQAEIYSQFNDKFKDIENKKKDIAIQTEQAITDAEIKEVDKRTAKLQQTVNLLQNSLTALFPNTDAFSTALSQFTNLGVSIGNIYSKLSVQVKEFNKIINSPDSTPAEVLAAAAQKKVAQQNATDEAITASIAATQTVINQVFADAAAQRQQEIADQVQALEDQKNTELNNANLTAKQKDEINKQYAAKERQVKIAGFKADLEAKKEEAIVNGFLAVTNALATTHPFIPAALIAAGVAAASTALQVAAISRTKIPKFRHGQIDIQGPGTSTSDSIPSLISRGESVIKAESTAKWKDALVAINDNHFEDYLGQKFKSFVFPHIPENTPIPGGKTQDIDYDRLAVAVAKEMKGVMPEPTHVKNIMTVDENGIRKFFEKGNTRTEWKNKRYSMD